MRRSKRGTVSRRQNSSHRSHKPLRRFAAPRRPVDLLRRPAAGRSSPAADPSRIARPAQAPPRRARPAGCGARRRSTRTAACRPGRRRARGIAGSMPASTACDSQQRRAEGVDRADPRRVQLANQLQPIVRPAPRGTPATGGGRQRGCGRAFPRAAALGECDGHQLAQAAAAVPPAPSRLQFGQKSLGQHGCFAAAGAGRKRDRHAAGRHCPLLLVGQTRAGSFCRRRLACLLQGSHLIDAADGAEGATAGAVLVGAARRGIGRREWPRPAPPRCRPGRRGFPPRPVPIRSGRRRCDTSAGPAGA